MISPIKEVISAKRTQCRPGIGCWCVLTAISAQSWGPLTWMPLCNTSIIMDQLGTNLINIRRRFTGPDSGLRCLRDGRASLFVRIGRLLTRKVLLSKCDPAELHKRPIRSRPLRRLNSLAHQLWTRRAQRSCQLYGLDLCNGFIRQLVNTVVRNRATVDQFEMIARHAAACANPMPTSAVSIWRM